MDSFDVLGAIPLGPDTIEVLPGQVVSIAGKLGIASYDNTSRGMCKTCCFFVQAGHLCKAASVGFPCSRFGSLSFRKLTDD